MKKIYTMAFLFAFFSQMNAQVLNQSAAWPNAAWTITGTYSSDPLAFEASPITTANFAYDDDDAGSGDHEDNIAAESPVIDLTAADAANETNISVSVDYGYYFLENDVLQFQYWNADTATWVAWPGGNIPGNNTTITDNFCLIPKTSYVTNGLDIAAFTATQLAGFKYRIFYDDDALGADWNYGFCFDSPTITSAACAAPTTLAVNNITDETADFSWDFIDGIAGFEYVLNDVEADPAGAGTVTTGIDYLASDLDPSTTYYFHLRTNCGSNFSEWRTISFTTSAAVPANDACATATAIPALPYTDTLDASAATNNDGVISACSGMNDGVWYTFTGTGSDVKIEVTDVNEWDPEIGVFTGDCFVLECVGDVDAAGGGGDEEIIIPATTLGTLYYINVGHYNGFEDVPEGTFTINVTDSVPPTPIDNDSCATAIAIASLPYTNTQDATGATNNDGIIAAGCDSDMNDGAWYTFTGDGNEIIISLNQVDNWDPQMDVYTGTCGTFTCVGSVDSGGTSGGETLTLETQLGVTYYINVGHYDGFDDVPEGPYTINLAPVLATESFDSTNFRAYPNPVKNVLNLSYDKQISNVAIFNLLGQQVMAQSINASTSQIDMSQLSNGTYMLKVTADDQVKTIKVVKQ